MDDTSTYHYSGHAQAGDQIADADPEIFTDSRQCGLCSQFSLTGPRNYLGKSRRRLTSGITACGQIDRGGASGRGIDFPATAISTGAQIAAGDNCHVAKLAEQAAIGSASSINL